MAGVKEAITIAQAKVEVTGWREAIRASCQPLVGSGAIEERYAERCIEIVEEQGPYIVVAPGIALAHARPENGVKRLCLSVTTLNEPVEFGHPENDPVDLVFAFGSPDSEQHIGLLQTLAERLQEGLARRLREAQTSKELDSLMRAVANAVKKEPGCQG